MQTISEHMSNIQSKASSLGSKISSHEIGLHAKMAAIESLMQKCSNDVDAFNANSGQGAVTVEAVPPAQSVTAPVAAALPVVVAVPPAVLASV